MVFVMAMLKDIKRPISQKLPQDRCYSIYKKHEIPSKYHFQNNDRIGNLLLVANPPYTFSPKGKNNGKAARGYAPRHSDIHGIF